MSTRSLFEELQSEFGGNTEGHGVSWSGDLARILQIPRRPAGLVPEPNATLGLTRDVPSCDCKELFGYCITKLNETQLRSLEEMKQSQGGLVLAGTGHGKALALDTPIPTKDGWKLMGDLSVGDELFDSRGQLCRVTFVTPIQLNRTCYKVTFDDGSSVVADAEHLWVTRTRNQRRQLDRGASTNTEAQVVTTEQIIKTIKTGEHINHSVDTCGSLELPQLELPLDPYLLGIWLGDGTTVTGQITSADGEVLEAFGEYGLGASRASGAAITQTFYGLGKVLREVGVLGNKHVPATYLRASTEQRLALLQGLMDSDGTCCKNSDSVEFCSTLEHLANQVFELAASLGQKPRLYTGRATLYGKDCGTKFRVIWSPTIQVFRLARKRARLQILGKTQIQRRSRRYIVDISPTESVPVKCITVDSPDHTYLCSKSMVPTHNTLISLLAPMVLGAQTTVLLIPPNLKAQLTQRDYPQASAHWNLPQLSDAPIYRPGVPVLYIVTYSDLSQTKNSELLKNIAPDLIVADEAHFLKDKKAARTKRFIRLFKELPKKPIFIALSGTMTSKSIKDYAHLSHLALGANTPLPTHWPTLEEWSGAIDPLKFNIAPGHLKRLCEPNETVRQGFRRRLLETPGVIATSDSSVGTSLVFCERPAEPLPLVLSKQLDHLRETWERPDGEELRDIMEYHRTATEMACGFYYQWVFNNGETEDLIREWKRVRKEYNKEVREKLKRATVNMDTVALVEEAAERHESGYKGPLPVWKSEMWAEWKAIRDRVQPTTEPVWVSKWLVENAFSWAQSTPRGIVWFAHQCFGDELEALGLARFGANSDEQVMAFVDSCKKKPKSFAASIYAHATGKNFQHYHNENLVCVGLSDAARWEQLIARTHRPGQPEDEVKVHVYRHTKELRESFLTAIERARYRKDTTVNTDKLCIGSYEFKP